MTLDIYLIILSLTCNRLGDVINEFRKKSLGLEPLSIRSGPGILDRIKVPWTYCFSPSLIPKPLDWKNHIGMYTSFSFTFTLTFILN
jgi:hypothetical protein